jgi:two-component system, NarL family, invasion response regulator UvrY
MRGEGSRLSVLLVDDHAVVREGYRRLLERRGDIVVVGEAADAPAAYSLFCSLTLPGVSGIGVTRRMLAHQPRARVLIFSMHEDTIFASRALLAGAAGYVTKASAPSVLVEAVHAVASGRRYLSPDIAQRLALRTFEVTQVRGLSEREFEVLRLLARGRTVREIAESMGLNAKTIANHQSAIKQKLGADTALQLLRKASQLGLDSDSDASAAPVADRMWEDR